MEVAYKTAGGSEARRERNLYPVKIMLSFIRTYFLRMYAIERRKGTKDERASHKEALFQLE